MPACIRPATVPTGRLHTCAYPTTVPPCRTLICRTLYLHPTLECRRCTSAYCTTSYLRPTWNSLHCITAYLTVSCNRYWGTSIAQMPPNHPPGQFHGTWQPFTKFRSLDQVLSSGKQIIWKFWNFTRHSLLWVNTQFFGNKSKPGNWKLQLSCVTATRTFFHKVLAATTSAPVACPPLLLFGYRYKLLIHFMRRGKPDKLLLLFTGPLAVVCNVSDTYCPRLNGWISSTCIATCWAA